MQGLKIKANQPIPPSVLRLAREKRKKGFPVVIWHGLDGTYSSFCAKPGKCLKRGMSYARKFPERILAIL